MFPFGSNSSIERLSSRPAESGDALKQFQRSCIPERQKLTPLSAKESGT
jgi:hypothetical protein